MKLERRNFLQAVIAILLIPFYSARAANSSSTHRLNTLDLDWDWFNYKKHHKIGDGKMRERQGKRFYLDGEDISCKSDEVFLGEDGWAMIAPKHHPSGVRTRVNGHVEMRNK